MGLSETYRNLFPMSKLTHTQVKKPSFMCSCIRNNLVQNHVIMKSTKFNFYYDRLLLNIWKFIGIFQFMCWAHSFLGNTTFLFGLSSPPSRTVMFFRTPKHSYSSKKLHLVYPKVIINLKNIKWDNIYRSRNLSLENINLIYEEARNLWFYIKNVFVTIVLFPS